jgi:hypothetical protein
MALLLCPRSVQITFPVPLLPFDSMCQDQTTFPLPPTVREDPLREDPLKDTGARPVEYSTLAVHTAPGELKAYNVG